jgi:hypothetical protein
VQGYSFPLRLSNIGSRVPAFLQSEPVALGSKEREKRVEGDSVSAKAICVQSRRFNQWDIHVAGKLASCPHPSFSEPRCSPRIPVHRALREDSNLHQGFVVGKSCSGFGRGRSAFLQALSVLLKLRIAIAMREMTALP